MWDVMGVWNGDGGVSRGCRMMSRGCGMMSCGWVWFIISKD